MANDNLIASDQSFSRADRDVLARVAQLIIGPVPAGVMPSAASTSVMTNILARALNFERQVRGGLAALATLAQEHHQNDSAELSDEMLRGLLDNQPELRSFSRAMMQIVAQSYYQDAQVLTALGMAARPPFPQGHEVEDGDWTLLDPVKARAPFYRAVVVPEKAD